jgi:hypothetical protein
LAGLLDRAFLLLLAGLAAIGLVLLGIFNLASFSELGLDLSIVSFLVVTALLVLGYMLGVVAVAFLAVFLLPRFWQRTKTKT